MFKKESSEREQSDKSSGEESDTEQDYSVMQARARHSWPAPSLVNYLHNRRRNVTRKRLQESLGESVSLGSV